MNLELGLPYFDLQQNEVLSREFADIATRRYGMSTGTEGSSASTDFGNVSYELPSLHPLFAIPTQPRGGNHTRAFADAAITREAHVATMTVTRALALTGFRVLDDATFFNEAKLAFETSKKSSTSNTV